jgi:hypothetical protein
MFFEFLISKVNKLTGTTRPQIKMPGIVPIIKKYIWSLSQQTISGLKNKTLLFWLLSILMQLSKERLFPITVGNKIYITTNVLMVILSIKLLFLSFLRKIVIRNVVNQIRTIITERMIGIKVVRKTFWMRILNPIFWIKQSVAIRSSDRKEKYSWMEK